MHGYARDLVLFTVCVVAPCAMGWSSENANNWAWTQSLGASLFVIAMLMVFVGLRMLFPGPAGKSRAQTAPSAPKSERTGASPRSTPGLEPFNASSEVIYVTYKQSSARVVALLRVGAAPQDVHLLELDVTGDDLRPETIAEAVAEVTSGEPSDEPAPVDKVGYAAGWGLTLPCPPFRH